MTEIRDRLDLDHIALMAVKAGVDLSFRAFAHVVLEPGDATRYEITVSDRIPWQKDADGVVVQHRLRGYTVSLVNLDGRSYMWEGIKLHPQYVSDKWCDGKEWAGVVLCEFLNALSDELGDDE